MTIDSEKIFGKWTRAQEKRNKMKRKIPENWVYFREYLNQKIRWNKIEREFEQSNKDKTWINRTWDNIENTIKQTINETIPIKEVLKSEVSNKKRLVSDTTKANKP